MEFPSFDNTFYPGVYSEEDQAVLDQRRAEDAEVVARGAVNPADLVSGKVNETNTPGIAPKYEVTRETMLAQAAKYDPDNPLYFDPDYARAHGYRDIIAYPSFAHNDDKVMKYMPEGWMGRAIPGSGLTHEIEILAPIYPGDTLYYVIDEQSLTDITPPEGARFYSFEMRNYSHVVNQRGETVLRAFDRIRDGLAAREDPATAPAVAMAPAWRLRPIPHYTNADYEKMKEYWRAEKRLGAEKRYWEDVAVGEVLIPTLDGPIVESPTAPRMDCGMGEGGWPTLRKECLDSEIYATMIEDEVYGIKRLPGTPSPAELQQERERYWEEQLKDPEIAEFEDEKFEGIPDDGRVNLINFQGRDYAIRMLMNWAGDDAWLEKICWGICPRPLPWDDVIAEYPEPVRYLDKVPFLKGRKVDVHAIVGDCCIARGIVVEKRECEGRRLVDVAWWLETFDEGIYTHGMATIRLLSRG